MTTRTDGPDWFHGPITDEPVVDSLVDSGVDSGVDPVAEQDESSDDDLLDDWAPPQRAGRLTRVLAAGLLGALVFTGGALVQKQFGGTTTGSAGAAGAFPDRSGGFPGGGELPAGGFGGAPGQGGSSAQGGASGQASGAAGQASGAASGGTSAAASGTSAVPAVVGTVTSVAGTDLVVENFAKATVTVHVPATASVTAPGLARVAAGMTVTVVGTKGADGSITATSVVARSKAS